jgi:hypothetical protein
MSLHIPLGNLHPDWQLLEVPEKLGRGQVSLRVSV